MGRVPSEGSQHKFGTYTWHRLHPTRPQTTPEKDATHASGEQVDRELQGVPQFQVAYAQRVGITGPAEIRAFVLANADQPDEFWLGSSGSLVELPESKLNSMPKQRMGMYINPAVPKVTNTDGTITPTKDPAAQKARSVKPIPSPGTSATASADAASALSTDTAPDNAPAPVSNADEASARADVALPNSNPAENAQGQQPPPQVDCHAQTAAHLRALAEKGHSSAAYDQILKRLALKEQEEIALPPNARVTLTGFPTDVTRMRLAREAIEAELLRENHQIPVEFRVEMDESGQGTGVVQMSALSEGWATDAAALLQEWSPIPGVTLRATVAPDLSDADAESESSEALGLPFWKARLVPGDVVDLNLLSVGVHPSLPKEALVAKASVWVRGGRPCEDCDCPQQAFPAEVIQIEKDADGKPTVRVDEQSPLNPDGNSRGKQRVVYPREVVLDPTRWAECDDTAKTEYQPPRSFWVPARVTSVTHGTTPTVPDAPIAVGDTVVANDRTSLHKVTHIDLDANTVTIVPVCSPPRARVVPRSAVALTPHLEVFWPSKVTFELIDSAAIPRQLLTAAQIWVSPPDPAIQRSSSIRVDIDGSGLQQSVATAGTRCLPWEAAAIQSGQVAVKVVTVPHVRVPPPSTLANEDADDQDDQGGVKGVRMIPLHGKQCLTWESGTVVSPPEATVLTIELPQSVTVLHAPHQEVDRFDLHTLASLNFEWFLYDFADAATTHSTMADLVAAFRATSGLEATVVQPADGKPFDFDRREGSMERCACRALTITLPRSAPASSDSDGAASLEDLRVRGLEVLAQTRDSKSTVFSVAAIDEIELVRVLADEGVTVNTSNRTQAELTECPVRRSDVGTGVMTHERQLYTASVLAEGTMHLASDNPRRLVGERVTVTASRPGCAFNAVVTSSVDKEEGLDTGVEEIVAYAPAKREHVVQTSSGGVRMLRFNHEMSKSDEDGVRVLVRIVPPGLPAHSLPAVTPLGYHYKQCSLCRSHCALQDFARFCFSTCTHPLENTNRKGVFGGDRHPFTICWRCFQAHAIEEVAAGTVCVTCPIAECGRALQLRELMSILPRAMSRKLPDSVRDPISMAEVENVRICPHCHARVGRACTRNDENACFRCGKTFHWLCGTSVTLRHALSTPAPSTADGSGFAKPAAQTSAFGGAKLGTGAVTPALGFAKPTAPASAFGGGAAFKNAGTTALGIVKPAAAQASTDGTEAPAVDAEDPATNAVPIAKPPAAFGRSLDEMFPIGKRCLVTLKNGSTVPGTVRSTAPFPSGRPTRVGVELDEPVNVGHNGTVDGHVFFTCKDKCGVHVPPRRITDSVRSE
eukprot:m.227715 g.227715  ORF g.227715 m.227715 type:complete len:1328 (-) comp15666_c0_seq1:84-4067(-)